MILEDIDRNIAGIVKRARASKGISQPELARRVGTTQQTIDKIENGIVKHSRYLPAIALELGVSLDRVLRFRQKDGAVAAIAGHTLVSGDRDLPVYAATMGSVGVQQVLSSTPVEYVSRPEPLARVRDGYGVIVADDTMVPEARGGDVALVNPHVPPRVGDTCVFRSMPDGETQHFCIKHLRKVDEKNWHVTEWSAENGRRDFTLKRSEWPIAHVAIGFYKRR